MNQELRRILSNVKNNVSRGLYPPLSKEDSKTVRAFYAEQIRLPLSGEKVKLTNEYGTIIATGYNRIVVGDYGPYVEITPDQIVKDNIEQRWPGIPSREVKYIWMQTSDEEKTKIYYQQNIVPYADYKPGMYYVDPRLVFFD